MTEFLDNTGVNNRDTAVGSPPPTDALKRPVWGVARAVEKALANPTLVIAGLAAIPLLFIAWGVTRRWKRKRESEPVDENEFE